MSTLVYKEKILNELKTQMRPFSGVFWQDINSTQGLVKADDFSKNPFKSVGPPTVIETAGGGTLVLDEGQFENLEGLVATPRAALALVAKPVIKLLKQPALVKSKPVSTLTKPSGKRALTKAEDAAIGTGLDRLKEKLTQDEFLRVYLADDVDQFLINIYNRLVDNIELLTLSQPAHAKRRRKKVASRN